jgi:hypothetical protein
LTPYLQPYKQNLLNFRHHFLFGVSSKIPSFWHYFTDKALNILFKFVCRLRNISKNKNFECSHNLKRYIIRISFERVLRNIQKNLLLTIHTVINNCYDYFGNLTGLMLKGFVELKENLECTFLCIYWLIIDWLLIDYWLIIDWLLIDWHLYLKHEIHFTS